MSISEKLANAKTVDVFHDLSVEEKTDIQYRAAVAARIFQLRNELGLSQAEFAARLGVRQNQVSRWESGETNFTLQTLAKIFSVSPASISIHEILRIPASASYTSVTTFTGAWSFSGVKPCIDASSSPLCARV